VCCRFCQQLSLTVCVHFSMCVINEYITNIKLWLAVANLYEWRCPNLTVHTQWAYLGNRQRTMYTCQSQHWRQTCYNQTFFDENCLMCIKQGLFADTRLPSNLRSTTHVCVVTRGHFQSRDKDGSHTIWSAIAQNPTLHANFMALSVTERQLWAIKVLHCWIFNLFMLLWPWPWRKIIK